MAFNNLANDSNSSDSSYDGTQYGLSCDTKNTFATDPSSRKKTFNNLGFVTQPQYMERPSNATIVSVEQESEEDSDSDDASQDSNSDESQASSDESDTKSELISPPNNATVDIQTDDTYEVNYAQPEYQHNTMQNMQQYSQSTRIMHNNNQAPYHAIQQMQQANSTMMMTQPQTDGFSISALQHVQNQMRQAMSERFAAAAQYQTAYNQPNVAQNYSADQIQQYSQSVQKINNDNNDTDTNTDTDTEEEEPQLTLQPSNYMQQIQQQSASVMHMNKSAAAQKETEEIQHSQSMRALNNVSYETKQNELIQMQQESASERFVTQPKAAIQQMQQQSFSVRALKSPKSMKIKKKEPEFKSLEIEAREARNDPPATLLLKKGNEIPIIHKRSAEHTKMKKMEKENIKREKCVKCKVCFGIFGGILAVLCVFAAFRFDEITKNNTAKGTFVCGHNSQYLCAGHINECQNALIFGYNLNLGNIGAVSRAGVNITQTMDFDIICGQGINEESCTEIEAGNIFYFANIAASIGGLLGLVLLCIPLTRKASSICYIIAAIAAAVAIGAYMVIASDTICWESDDAQNEVGLAVSCLLDFIAFGLFLVTSILMICFNYILICKEEEI